MKNTAIKHFSTLVLSLSLSMTALAQPTGQPIGQPTWHYTWDGYSLSRIEAPPERASGAEEWGYVFTDARTGKKQFRSVPVGSAPGLKSASDSVRYLKERQESERRYNATFGANNREYAQAVAPVAKIKIKHRPIVWTFVPKNVVVPLIALTGGSCSCK